jgi:hypothetical protein
VTTPKLALAAVTNPIIAKNSINSTQLQAASTHFAFTSTGFKTVPAGHIIQLTAPSCPADHPFVISRSYITKTYPPPQDMFILDDSFVTPNGEPTMWSITVHNPTSTDEQIILQAACGNVVP